MSCVLIVFGRIQLPGGYCIAGTIIEPRNAVCKDFASDEWAAEPTTTLCSLCRVRIRIAYAILLRWKMRCRADRASFIPDYRYRTELRCRRVLAGPHYLLLTAHFASSAWSL